MDVTISHVLALCSSISFIPLELLASKRDNIPLGNNFRRLKPEKKVQSFLFYGSKAFTFVPKNLTLIYSQSSSSFLTIMSKFLATKREVNLGKKGGRQILITSSFSFRTLGFVGHLQHYNQWLEKALESCCSGNN